MTAMNDALVSSALALCSGRTHGGGRLRRLIQMPWALLCCSPAHVAHHNSRLQQCSTGAYADVTAVFWQIAGRGADFARR